MKGVYDVLRGSFLTGENSFKNWRVIVFVVGLLLVMIWSSHSIDEKVTQISILHKKKRELREIYVDTKKTLALIRLESSVRKKVKSLGVEPSSVPPKKIRVVFSE